MSDAERHPEWAAEVDPRVEAQARECGPRHILLIGDSLTEQNPLTQLCGLPVINAGYSGGRWDTVTARPIWSRMQSSVAVILLGTNDVMVGRAITHDGVLALVKQISADRVFLETPPSLFDEHGSPIFAQAIWDAERVLVGVGLPTFSTRWGMNHPKYFHDGVHFNAEGYAVHNALLERLLSDELS